MGKESISINIYDNISENIDKLNKLYQLKFGFPFIEPKSITLICEFLKPVNTLNDLNIRLMQFGLLIDSIPEKKIKSYLIKHHSEIKQKIDKKKIKQIIDSDEIKFYKKHFEIEKKFPYFFEIKPYRSLELLNFLLQNVLINFNDSVIEDLRFLRSLRNTSKFAHEMSIDKISKKYQKLGFIYPLDNLNIGSFWDTFLRIFSEKLDYLSTKLHEEISKQYNNDLIDFESVISKSNFTLEDNISIRFSIKNKSVSEIYLHAYQYEFVCNEYVLYRWNWHFYNNTSREILQKRELITKKWDKVKPEYYSIKNTGNWKMITRLMFNLSEEKVFRVVTDSFKFKVNT